MRRKFAPSTVLTEEEVRDVHRLSMRILSEVGLTFHAESAWETLEANGCLVDRGTGNVRFDPTVVEHFVGLAPSSFDIAARDPSKTVHHMCKGNATNLLWQFIRHQSIQIYSGIEARNFNLGEGRYIHNAHGFAYCFTLGSDNIMDVIATE